ncbi:MAG TPA: ATP-binding protein [Coriobacteriia bacterium]
MADGDRVVLIVPALGEFARTVRMTAAELASHAGMDIEGIEDVRLAVEEAFVFASERVADAVLTFTFTVGRGSIEVEVAPLLPGCDADEGPDRGERYARFILESICDEFELTTQDAVCRLRLVKRTV